MNEVMDESEVAAILDCEPSTAQAWAREGKLPAVKAGRSWRFPRQALMEAINEQARKNMRREAPAPKAVKVKARPVLVGL